jgi:hypothetical protein
MAVGAASLCSLHTPLQQQLEQQQQQQQAERLQTLLSMQDGV